MFSSGRSVTRQLSPLVSMKSCLVMAVGSMWCSRNGRMKAWGGQVVSPVSQRQPMPRRPQTHCRAGLSLAQTCLDRGLEGCSARWLPTLVETFPNPSGPQSPHPYCEGLGDNIHPGAGEEALHKQRGPCLSVAQASASGSSLPSLSSCC